MGYGNNIYKTSYWQGIEVVQVQFKCAPTIQEMSFVKCTAANDNTPVMFEKTIK